MIITKHSLIQIRIKKITVNDDNENEFYLSLFDAPFYYMPCMTHMLRLIIKLQTDIFKAFKKTRGIISKIRKQSNTKEALIKKCAWSVIMDTLKDGTAHIK